MEYFADLGYIGLFISCFLAATFVIPFSPEVILGILILKGFNLQLTIIIATIGNWMGGMTSYFIGRIGDWKKIEKYFKIKKEKVNAFKKRIDKWGSVLAFFTWFPLGGDILALSLGVF
jgi:membrane protein YqaA with SNARE-associated domain